MTETRHEEIKRYVGFGLSDEASLRAFLPTASGHFERIVAQFYTRVAEHEAAMRVFHGELRSAGHEAALHDWLQSLLRGPWDESYYERHVQIGKVHVQIELPQHYLFAAMNLIRQALADVASSEYSEPSRSAVLRALHKLLDIELAIMLESYREAYVDRLELEVRRTHDDLQRRLLLSEARYEEIVEKAEALITTIDRHGRVSLFNSKCERLTGLSRSTARGTTWLDIFVSPEDHARVQEQHRRALAGEAGPSYEGRLAATGAREYRVRWHFTTLPNGLAPELCAIGIDVSNEHELGIRTRRAERMAALGTMAAGLAHEIRNPLNSAVLQLRIAERRLRRIDSQREAPMTAVLAAAAELERLGALVYDFLQFAQPQPLQLVRVDLRRTLESGVERLAHDAKDHGVDLRLLPGDTVFAEADPQKLAQLIEKLAQNAIQAVSAAGGRVELSATARGAYADLSVWDDGPGLPPDAPIFAPFFTTKEHGTGLGLAIVHRIALDHGGDVSVQSMPGNTRFTVSLPRA